MNPCQLQYVEYVKSEVFPGTEIEDTANPSEEYIVAQVSIESLKYTFMLCCLFTKKKDVYLPENIIELGPDERKQIFYLVGKGGSCKSPNNQYLIPAHLGGAKIKERDLKRYVMLP